MFRRLLLLFVGVTCACADERKLDFSAARESETPAGFRSAQTGSGRGPAGQWKIVMEDVPPVVAPLSAKSPVVNRRPVLAQLSTDKDESRSPLFIYEAEPFKDFTVSTRFKIISGTVEQMAGLAFRLQDEKNYYYVRANAKEQNVAFFRYVDGELIGGVSQPAEVKRGEWNLLMVECQGGKLRALLNEREIIPWTEPNLIPFPDGSNKGVFAMGQVAFWTKADSVVYFADTRIDFTPREPFAQTLVRETMRQHPRLRGLKIYGVAGTDPKPHIIASTNEKEIGEAGDALEKDCIEKGGSYFGKGSDVALVTMPLRDRNGETVGAVRVAMTTFFGQTEKNGLARALPIVKSMSERISSAKELAQ